MSVTTGEPILIMIDCTSLLV